MSEQPTLEEVRKPIGRMPDLPKGCDEWTEQDHGYKILQVHYSADPSKTPAWAEAQKKKSPSENTFKREFEIDHYAGSGAVMYPEFSRAINVCKPFPIPHEWTRYMGIDPHKRRPHAFLWMAVSPDGDHWCVSPDTKILTADLTHMAAGDLEIGDKLAGFDEFPKKNQHRHWHESGLEDIRFISRPCVRIVLDDGTEHICSEEHLWLTCGPLRYERRAHTGTSWCQAGKLVSGKHRILRLTDVWSEDLSKGAGYLAAAFDGEGSYSHNSKGTPTLSFNQKENVMLENVQWLLAAKNLRYGRYGRVGGVRTLSITGKHDELRFLGSIRPLRLLEKFSVERLVGCKAFTHPTVLAVEPIGTREVVAMRTSTRTFVANGLASHNCYREYWPSRVYGKKGDTPEDDKLYKVDEYVQALKYMEGPEIRHFSPGGFADNGGLQEKIRIRVQDTHGKAIFTTTIQGKDDPETFWQRYEDLGIRCTEAIKDIGSGRDTVGMRLRARKVMLATGEAEQSVIHIFDTLPELIHEMRTGRFPALTPSQAERMDPTEKELQKRKHMLDLIRYIEIEDPKFVARNEKLSSVRQIESGINY